MMQMTALPQIASQLPRRGLSCSEAATYIGLGQTKFLSLVSDGKMPSPVRIDRRVIWDIRDLDIAFDLLREDQIAETSSAHNNDAWGDDTP